MRGGGRNLPTLGRFWRLRVIAVPSISRLSRPYATDALGARQTVIAAGKEWLAGRIESSRGPAECFWRAGTSLGAGDLVRTEQPVATPADPQEPSGGLGYGRITAKARRRAVAETVEVRRAGQRVQLRRRVADVMPVILEHVKESSPHFERRTKCARVEPVGKD
jgi:hypothetical protein